MAKSLQSDSGRLDVSLHSLTYLICKNARAFYPPGGFMNYLQRSQLPPQPHMRGEDFHLVGQSMSFNPISPPPPPSAYGAVPSKPVHIEIDEGENGEEDRPARKRYWTHDEEERLVINLSYILLKDTA